ncbi:MAG TPA: biotin--[acetyl-CoA-carboxylase] ligase [Firmicutes bacterium]|nr:biotin--[acetyl-CoA-carboxylase] ligase [Bacillota bacterium]
MKHVLLQFDILPSTSTYLKEHPFLEDGTVVSSSSQSKGRGRLGRIWQDDGNSLLFSFLLKGDKYASILNIVSILTGAAMEKTLLDMGFDSKVKWPNDIYLNDKKICGILVESSFKEKLEAIYVGVGLNLNNKSFPNELKENATSLFLESKKEFNKFDVLKEFLSNFDSLLLDCEKGKNSFYQLISKNDYLKGKKVYLNYYGENKYVTSLGIDIDGKMIVKDENEKITKVTSGEATLIKKSYSLDL